MARRFKVLTEKQRTEMESGLESYACYAPEAWQYSRLLAIFYAAQSDYSGQQIARAIGKLRATVFRYLQIYRFGGFPSLLRQEHRGGGTPSLGGPLWDAFVQEVRVGGLPDVKKARTWIQKRTKKLPAESTVYRWLAKAKAAPLQTPSDGQ